MIPFFYVIDYYRNNLTFFFRSYSCFSLCYVFSILSLSFVFVSKPTEDAVTMFHEFGHAHHGMLSDATYGRLASTNVMTDFVELPSQLMEHWFSERAVLEEFARHYETQEPVPDELLDKLETAEQFNEGFATIEYTICALLDMAMHQIDNYDDFDMHEFEQKELERLQMPQGIVMRHRPAVRMCVWCYLYKNTI